MRQVLATELSDRPVMGADGERLGTVHNVTMNPTTGELVSVVVTPRGTSTASSGRTRAASASPPPASRDWTTTSSSIPRARRGRSEAES